MTIFWNKAQQLDFQERFERLRKRQRWNVKEMAAQLSTTMTIVASVGKGFAPPPDAVLLRFAELEEQLADGRSRQKRVRDVPHETEPV